MNKGQATIRIDTSPNGVATIWFDNAARRNALSDPMLDDIIDVMGRLAKDDGCRLLVLRGAGGTFCAGRDVGGGVDLNSIRGGLTRLGDLLTTLRAFPRPTLAAVEGAAMGLGMAVVASCDLAIAEEHAIFAIPEAKMGMSPTFTAVVALRSLPRKTAMEVMLTARRLSAAEAKAAGLVNTVVPKDCLGVAIDEMTAAILALSPSALERAKELGQAIEGLDFDQAIGCAIETGLAAVHDPDVAEGMAAFRAKRTPVWSQIRVTPVVRAG